VNARQRRQFIPQGAISFMEIAVVLVDLFDIVIFFNIHWRFFVKISAPDALAIAESS
jgi:hypothetical protein